MQVSNLNILRLLPMTTNNFRITVQPLARCGAGGRDVFCVCGSRRRVPHVVGDVPAVGVDGNEMDPGEEPLSLDSLTKDDEIRRKQGPD